MHSTAPTRPGRPIQLGYYTIHTDDIAKAATFYSQVLGWEVDPASGHVSNCDLPFGFQTDHGDGRAAVDAGERRRSR